MNYADEAQFHMDVLPSLPDGLRQRELRKALSMALDHVDKSISITDRKHPHFQLISDEWPSSNPNGYAEWFYDRMRVVFDALRKSIMLNEAKADVSDIPAFRVKTPLQSAIQILKFHRDKRFSNNPDLKPASIILTTLAAHAYQQEATISGALLSILLRMDSFIERREGTYWIPNPSDPRENFADHWNVESAWLIIDDTSLPKKGRASVGVAPQYASALGKNANCQSLVSMTLASGEVPVMIGLQLLLPDSWTNDPVRLDRAGVPEECRAYKTKPEIALAQIDRARKSGVRFGCVLADAGYGLSGPFRQGLTERGLTWAVGIPFKQKVYPANVAMVFPVAGRGRPRQRHIPDTKSVAAQRLLEAARWRTVSWRRGTKGKLSARFAAVRVKVADGPPQRIHDMGAQHLPGEEVWLVGEHRSTGERKYYLSNLPADTPIKDLTAAIKARWICEQAHQQPKEELGLDHFEGRSWIGLHRHSLMTMIAYAFLQYRRLIEAARKKKNQRPTSTTNPPTNPASDHGSLLPLK